MKPSVVLELVLLVWFGQETRSEMMQMEPASHNPSMDAQKSWETHK